MGYGVPESYGLSPLSQLRTGQKVWGIGSYGLSEGMGYGEFDCRLKYKMAERLPSANEWHMGGGGL